MTLKELEEVKLQYLRKYPYKMVFFKDYDYSILSRTIISQSPAGRGESKSINKCWIMADTETSKKPDVTFYNGKEFHENHVVAWTVSIRAYHYNIVTLWGRTPSEFIKCCNRIHAALNGDQTIIYFHNFSYDYVFLRKFMYSAWGTPEHELATKPHYPILLRFNNGLIFKDSLILGQRKLEKWGEDLGVEHAKAVGCWDYSKLRNQNEVFTEDELLYIRNDTLCGVECLDKTATELNKWQSTIPLTATGIPRNDIRNIAKVNRGHDWYLRQAPSAILQKMLENVYHGGYVHANRLYIDVLIKEIVKCYDFASSYPFCMLAEKYPCEAFSPLENKDINYILRNSENYAFMFKLILTGVQLKYNVVMPALQLSKCVKTINATCDNGRIISADYVEIYLTEQDLAVIDEQYNHDIDIVAELYVAKKDYLPRWITDYVYSLFVAKTNLKGEDKVKYSLAKAKLNSCYGMCVQQPVKEEIVEDFSTGTYSIDKSKDYEELYNKHVKNYNSVLPYQVGVWVTAYAFRHLFELSKCCKTHLYSDTDSCYGIGWNEAAVAEYNQKCKDKLLSRGYGPVNKKGRDYWLGVAESDGDNDTYTEFKVMGAKRYAGRCKADGKIHITVAGVPKKGAECLKDDLNNFTKEFVFPGSKTGKLTHSYNFIPEIYTDKYGNETGDSIDLTPCDYALDAVDQVGMELFIDEVEMIIYEED